MVKPVTLLFSLLLISSFSPIYGWIWPEGTENPDLCMPDQVHLNLGDAYYNTLSPATMEKADKNTNAVAVITWQTQIECKDNYLVIESAAEKFTLELKFEQLSVQAFDETIEAKQNGNNKEGRYQSYSYTAYLKDLKPGVVYTYQIKQKNGEHHAGPFEIKLPPLAPVADSFKFAVYGDIDTLKTNDTVDSLGRMYNNSATRFDFQVFVGDLAYDVYTENGLRGEYFFNKMQPLHARSPFMVNPGNHEWYKNYTFLNFRTKMPLFEQTQNHYYSFNVGKMHFINLNYYLYDNEGDEIKERMIKWLEDDLVAANANRKERPWIVVFTHQPLYCSMNDPNERENHRCYYFSQKNMMYDKLYSKYKVDFVLQAHIHYYERTGPVVNNQSQKYNSWSEENKKNYYINPEGPIYTIEGSPGNNYYMETDPTPLMDYSVISDTTFGFTTIKLVNETAVYYEHVSSDTGKIIDYFYILKGDEYKGVPINPVAPKKPTSPLMWIMLGGIIVFAILLGVLISRRFNKRVDELRQNMLDSRRMETEIYGV